jgi:hypothetical protein
MKKLKVGDRVIIEKDVPPYLVVNKAYTITEVRPFGGHFVYSIEGINNTFFYEAYFKLYHPKQLEFSFRGLL